MSEAITASLNDLLNASSVAVVGASADPTKVSGRPLAYMLKRGFSGNLYPVNPGRDTVQGVKSYPSLRDINEPIDLAIIGTTADKVCSIVEEGIDVGVKTFVVFSSGFAEVGNEGEEMQKELSALAQNHGVRILGPNCLGIANSTSNLIASFTTALEEHTLQKGSFAFISQSGALGAYWLDLVLSNGMGFSQWITTGNECDIDAAEALDFLVDDPATKVIGLYLEDIRNTFAFRKALQRAAAAGKPVIAIKSGSSDAGSKAAASHTGAIAGDDSLYDACLKQYGALRVDSLTAMMNVARLFLYDSVPAGNKLAVLSVSGGAGVLIADKSEKLGLALPDFSEQTKSTLKGILPGFSTPNNPLDLTGNVVQDTESVYKSVKTAAEDPEVDAIVLFVGLMHSIADKVTDALVRAKQQINKPVILIWIGAEQNTLALTDKAKIPTFADIPEAMDAIAQALSIPEIQRKAAASRVMTTGHAAAKTTHAITEWDAKQKLFSQDSISLPSSVLLRPGERAESLPFPAPLVAKIQSTQLLHKSDAGGVILKIDNLEKLNAAIENLEAKARELNLELQGVLVEQMVPFEHELLLGLRRDPKFGPAITLARGGIEVELDPDYATRLLPLDASQVQDMINSLRSVNRLQGYRGIPAVDISAVAANIAAFCDWFLQEHTLEEVEINPLAVKGSLVFALDALVEISPDTNSK
ncbi:acetate--CoA ligase family protein [Vreelandella titanicae]|uniref:Protein lysine acetyltransferase Pka n=1 Tax=Vreelandella titanicae TaxID=664683 RepID=A0AAP9T393_9GAMM|nr:acetate--CoA ligase family protein [Halomonas titanicae]QKS26763.1 Protein lysine acetyltransferase Pka [Halomonas titanicae]